MFGDIVKIAARAAALIAGVALIVVLFSVIQIPALDLSAAGDYINLAFTVCMHYIPGFNAIWGLGMGVLFFDVALIGVKLGLISIKWILKVNE